MTSSIRLFSLGIRGEYEIPCLHSRREWSLSGEGPRLERLRRLRETIDGAILQAEESMRTWIDGMRSLGQYIPGPSSLEELEVPAGAMITTILHVDVKPDSHLVRANLNLDSSILEAIDSEANRRAGRDQG